LFRWHDSRLGAENAPGMMTTLTPLALAPGAALFHKLSFPVHLSCPMQARNNAWPMRIYYAITTDGTQEDAERIRSTWGRKVSQPHKVEYYAGSIGGNVAGSDVVRLNGIDNTEYPPVKKTFAIWKAVAQQEEYYDWYMRCDSDSFVQLKAMENLLRGLDPTRPVYTGRSVIGREEDRASMVDDDFREMMYADGGSCEIVSRGAMVAWGRYLTNDACGALTARIDAQYQHSDVEVGRCLHKVGVGLCAPQEGIGFTHIDGGGNFDIKAWKQKLEKVSHAIFMKPRETVLNAQSRAFSSADDIMKAADKTNDEFVSMHPVKDFQTMKSLDDRYNY